MSRPNHREFPATRIARGAPERSPDIALRSPDEVMRLARLGSFHQTRLSFMRVLLRRLHAQGWRFDVPIFRVDARGEGVAVYRAQGDGRTYSLVAFPHDLDPAKRSDRVIADEWDATFALHDGDVGETDIDRLAANVPRQEAGRFGPDELVLSRANRSVRLFDHAVDRLAEGRQPDGAEIERVGYLMRTTAVYGNGKFGLSDRERICGRPECAGSFSPEMLSVWLIRSFTVDLAEHLARSRAPQTAVRLDPVLRRCLGVGNSTGLGMAPFLVNHPSLLHRWIAARETALARVRGVEAATPDRIAIFADRLARARRDAARWRVDDPVQSARVADLERDLARLAKRVATRGLAPLRPWDDLFRWAEARLGLEGQEHLVTLLLEPYGDLVDDLAPSMSGDEDADFRIDGAMRLDRLAHLIEANYGFSLGIDFTHPGAQARFWYVSEEKLEPRLGERAHEPGSEREQPLAVGRDTAALLSAVRERSPDTSVAAFLMAAPEFRHVVRRVQIVARRPYSEIRDNLLDAGMRPVDLLRCKLSFFGATRFDPKSDRWVRISMFRHAPFPDELGSTEPDNWAIPPLEGRA